MHFFVNTCNKLFKTDKKKPTPIPSGGKNRTANKDQVQQSRASSRNQEKTDERTKFPLLDFDTKFFFMTNH